MDNRTALVIWTFSIPFSISFGAVNFTSRHSVVHNDRTETSVGFPYYNENWTYDQMGTGSVVMTNYSHSDTVTNAGVSGLFGGIKVSGRSNSISEDSRASLEAYFTVSGVSTVATIQLNGGTSGDISKPPKPEGMNAYFVIYNADTNAVVFDSYNYGVLTVIPQDNIVQFNWTSVSTNVTLATGHYRLLVGGDGDNSLYYGFGRGSTGSGAIAVNMTFAEIPAPGAAVLLGIGCVAGVRRRRR